MQYKGYLKPGWYTYKLLILFIAFICQMCMESTKIKSFHFPSTTVNMINVLLKKAPSTG